MFKSLMKNLMNDLERTMRAEKITPMILCASCYRKLWVMKKIGENSTLIPATPVVPYYSEDMTTCPYCDQSFLLDNRGERRLIYKDEMDGHLEQRLIEETEERKIA
jgi:hypothetical protein